MKTPMSGVVERQKGLEIKPLLPPKKVGIYIQVPFCQTKCTYCNFHTGVASPAAYAPYARAVENEIRNWRDFFMRQKPRDGDALLPPDHGRNGLLSVLPS